MFYDKALYKFMFTLLTYLLYLHYLFYRQTYAIALFFELSFFVNKVHIVQSKVIFLATAAHKTVRQCSTRSNSIRPTFKHYCIFCFLSMYKMTLYNMHDRSRYL